MSKRSRKNRDDGEPSSSFFDNRIVTIVGGALFVVLFIVLGVVLVTALGGSGLSDKDKPALGYPALGDVPDIERSSAADLLTNKSFEEMTADERAQVAAEGARVFAEARVRLSSGFVPAVDLFRHDGHTRASRQYRLPDTTSPGGEKLLTTSTTFFCDGPPDTGSVDVYQAVDNGVEVTTQYERKSADSPPMERVFSGADWSAPKDLGFGNFGGRRVHGVQLQYRPQETSTPVDVQHWYDVENARLLRWKDVRVEDAYAYTIDWHAPEPLLVPEQLNTPPCATMVASQ